MLHNSRCSSATNRVFVAISCAQRPSRGFPHRFAARSETRLKVERHAGPGPVAGSEGYPHPPDRGIGRGPVRLHRLAAARRPPGLPPHPGRVQRGGRGDHPRTRHLPGAGTRKAGARKRLCAVHGRVCEFISLEPPRGARRRISVTNWSTRIREYLEASAQDALGCRPLFDADNAQPTGTRFKTRRRVDLLVRWIREDVQLAKQP